MLYSSKDEDDEDLNEIFLSCFLIIGNKFLDCPIYEENNRPIF